MTVVQHRMPRELFEALARGQGGVTAVRELAAAQHSKHLILLRAVREAARSAGDQFAARGYELLAEVQRRDPAAAAAVITHPSVGAWALRTLRGGVRGGQSLPGATPAGLAAVAAAAAIRAGLPARIELPVRDGIVMLPSLGAATASGPTAVVATRPAQVRSDGLRVAVGADGPRWQGLRRIEAGSLRVLLDDLDPFRMPSAENLTSRLTPAAAASLTAMLRAAWPLLNPPSAAEVAAIIRVLVPCATPPRGFMSSSSPENFGAVALSMQRDEYACAATLVHEAQHLKLSALLDLVPLTRPDDGQRYYAPWRTDPRPASGLLQGAYAFLGVSGFWRRQRHLAADPETRRRAGAEFARWRAGADRVVRTLLSSGQLTAAGRDFVLGISAVLGPWLREPLPADALALAQREAGDHMARWRSDNGIPLA